MKKIINFLRNNSPLFIIFLFWTPIAYFNTKIYWMLVDDGVSVVFSRTLFEKISNLNFIGVFSQLLEGGGRLRPTYWLYQMVVWIIGKNSYQLWHLVHMLVIGATVLFIYLIVKKLTDSKSISLFAGLFYILSPLNSENIFRIGPQEPLLALLLATLLYLFSTNRKNNLLACIIAILTIFTKETSIAILPTVYLYYLFVKKSKILKNEKSALSIFVTTLVSSVILIVVTLLNRSGYSTNYSFDLPIMTANLAFYLKEFTKNTLYIFPLTVITYLVRNTILLVKKEKIFDSKFAIFQFLFFVSFICFLFVQLPWKYALVRYLMPASIFLIAFIFLEIYKDINILTSYKFVGKYKKMIYSILVVFGIYASLLWSAEIIFRESSNVSYEKAFEKMASCPKNTTVLVNMPDNEGTIELVYETGLQLSEFWQRSDLNVEYLDLKNLPKDNYVIVDSDQLPRKYSVDELNKLYKNKYFSIKETTKGLVVTTPLELIKQSVKKIIKYVSRKDKINSEGLYTYYYNYNNWSFYDELNK